ncbi:MAG: hypothetical protein IPH62_09700 [Ignavibacteriae bacterium]|nr:hypothetical protein [Ignavibacteriota bacterium]
MINYSPHQFSDLFNTPFGKDLWGFLNEHDNIIRMITASDLQRPAVEPLSEVLLSRFGKKIKDDRTKQMIGHMVRQIMEAYHYYYVSNNIKIRFGSVFNRASKYSRNK